MTEMRRPEIETIKGCGGSHALPDGTARHGDTEDTALLLHALCQPLPSWIVCRPILDLDFTPSREVPNHLDGASPSDITADSDGVSKSCRSIIVHRVAGSKTAQHRQIHMDQHHHEINEGTRARACTAVQYTAVNYTGHTMGCKCIGAHRSSE